MTDIKSFLHEWCTRNRKEPTFESRSTGNLVWNLWFAPSKLLFLLGPKHRPRFLCELHVDGISYVGAGNSTTKKQAEKNAARDFIRFLIRAGEIDANDVPTSLIEQADSFECPSDQAEHESLPVFEVRFI